MSTLNKLYWFSHLNNQPPGSVGLTAVSDYCFTVTKEEKELEKVENTGDIVLSRGTIKDYVLILGNLNFNIF